VVEEDAGSPADQVSAVRLVDAIDGVRTDVDMAAAMGTKCDRVRLCTCEEGVARDDAVFENRETDRPAVPVDRKCIARDDHIPIADQVFAVEAFAQRRLREPVPPGLDRRVGRLKDFVFEGFSHNYLRTQPGTSGSLTISELQSDASARHERPEHLHALYEYRSAGRFENPMRLSEARPLSIRGATQALQAKSP
jgi:hypothetical protein